MMMAAGTMMVLKLSGMTMTSGNFTHVEGVEEMVRG